MNSWVPNSPHISPSSLVYVGNDGDGSAMFVGRAHHNGDLIPGKVLHVKTCHISYNGEEIPKESFELLMNGSFEWKSSSDGNIPPNAVVGGHTSTGETLYIGRAVHSGVTTPGKVHPSHRCVYIPFGWKEHRYTNYEVLVSRNFGVCPPAPCPINPPHFPQHRPHFPPGRGHHHGGHHRGHHH